VQILSGFGCKEGGGWLKSFGEKVGKEYQENPQDKKEGRSGAISKSFHWGTSLGWGGDSWQTHREAVIPGFTKVSRALTKEGVPQVREFAQEQWDRGNKGRKELLHDQAEPDVPNLGGTGGNGVWDPRGPGLLPA